MRPEVIAVVESSIAGRGFARCEAALGNATWQVTATQTSHSPAAQKKPPAVGREGPWLAAILTTSDGYVRERGSRTATGTRPAARSRHRESSSPRNSGSGKLRGRRRASGSGSRSAAAGRPARAPLSLTPSGLVRTATVMSLGERLGEVEVAAHPPANAKSMPSLASTAPCRHRACCSSFLTIETSRWASGASASSPAGPVVARTIGASVGRMSIRSGVVRRVHARTPAGAAPARPPSGAPVRCRGRAG